MVIHIYSFSFLFLFVLEKLWHIVANESAKLFFSIKPNVWSIAVLLLVSVDSDLTAFNFSSESSLWLCSRSWLPDSNITQAGAFLREAWVSKGDLCVTLSASLLGWFSVSAVMEPLQVEPWPNRRVCWCYSDHNYFAEIQFRSFFIVNYWKKKKLRLKTAAVC